MGAAKTQKNVDLPDEREGLLTEYRALKSEIHNAQGQRLQIISLTVGALGVVLSVSANAVLGAGNSSPEIRLLLAVGGSMVLYALLIPSLIMMLSLQQAIQRLGSYIRIYIEPRVPGLNWENRWQEYMQKKKYSGGLRGLGGIYYFLSLLPILLPLFAASQSTQNWEIIFVLVPFLVWALYLSYDLHAAVSKGWRWAKWDDQD